MKCFPTSRYFWPFLSNKLNIGTSTCITAGSFVWTFFEIGLDDHLRRDIFFWFPSWFAVWEVLLFNKKLLLSISLTLSFDFLHRVYIISWLLNKLFLSEISIILSSNVAKFGHFYSFVLTRNFYVLVLNDCFRYYRSPLC